MSKDHVTREEIIAKGDALIEEAEAAPPGATSLSLSGWVTEETDRRIAAEEVFSNETVAIGDEYLRVGGWYDVFTLDRQWSNAKTRTRRGCIYLGRYQSTDFHGKPNVHLRFLAWGTKPDPQFAYPRSFESIDANVVRVTPIEHPEAYIELQRKYDERRAAYR